MPSHRCVLRVAALLAAGVLAAPAVARAAAPADGDPLARAIRQARELFLAGRYDDGRAVADSLLRIAVARDGSESENAYAAREVLVENLLVIRHHPEPATCALAQRTLDFRVRTATADSTGMLRALQLAARCVQRSGEIETAISLQRRAIAIEERAHGTETYDLSVQLNNLGSMLVEAGRFDETRSTMERALAIRVKLRPPDDPDVMRLRNNLAVALEGAGDYAAALPLYEQVVASYERVWGPEHGKTGYALHNLAGVLAATGDRARARELYQRALHVRETAAGVGRYEIAETLGGLGQLLLEDGDPQGARPLFERALAIATSDLRADHPYRIQALLGLSATHRTLGEYDEARRLAREALAAVEAGQGPDHIDVAWALTTLGEVELAAREPRAAIPGLERAIAILVRSLGETHPRVGEARRLLAQALARVDDPGALPQALEAERIERDHLRETFRALPERQALQLRSNVRGGLDVALGRLAVMGQGPLDDPAARAHRDSTIAAVWDAVIRSRALVLDETTSRIHLDRSSDTTVARLAHESRAARQRAVNLAVRGPRDEAPAVYRSRLEQSRREADRAEAAVAQQSVPYREALARGHVGLAEVARALPRGAALIAYVRYEADSAATEYGCFVLGDSTGTPAYASLGSAAEIDSLVVRWQRAVHRTSGDPAGGEAGYRRVAAELRRRIWDPAAARVGHARTAFVVQDGALSLVSFATLPAGRAGYLIEHEPTFHYLTTGRGLVREGHVERSRTGLLVAVGGVSYDAAPGAGRPPAAVASAASGPAEAHRETPAHQDCAGLEALTFAGLPQSQREAEEVGRLWAAAGPDRGVRILSGPGATEEAFCRLAPQARILHVATHGFFREATCQPAEEDDPLVRSGLALAGANRRDRPPTAAGDGILTAAEVAALDLSQADWVVLSGCETGLGTPATMEGLLGLRRAFEVAGAGTVVMSLWGVEDAAVRYWIRALYQARLERGLDADVAVRDASRAMLALQRARGHGGIPATWGAFVSFGDR